MGHKSVCGYTGETQGGAGSPVCGARPQRDYPQVAVLYRRGGGKGECTVPSLLCGQLRRAGRLPCPPRGGAGPRSGLVVSQFHTRDMKEGIRDAC